MVEVIEKADLKEKKTESMVKTFDHIKILRGILLFFYSKENHENDVQ